MSEAPFPFAGEASALASSLLWAVAGVLFIRVRRGVSGTALNFGKNVTALACFLALLLLVQGRPWPARAAAPGVWMLVLSGVSGLTICDTLLFRAFLEIGPRRSTLFLALAPVLAGVVALLPPFGEHPPLLAWVGMGVCLGGIFLALTERSFDPVRQAQLTRGARYALFSAVFQAIGVLLARQGLRVGGVSTAEAATIRMASGCAGLVVLGVATRRLAPWITQLGAPGVWRRVALAAFLGTFLGIWSNQAGLAWAMHTGVATTLNSLAPVFLIPLSALFLGEGHDGRAWASTLLAIVGIALMTVV